MNVEPARPLNDDENAVLRLLLRPEFDGVEQLRAQVDGARVIGRCDCGCPTIYIEAADGAASAPVTARLSPVELHVSAEGSDPPGEIILFLQSGRISSMEYVYYSAKPPDRWPQPDRLTTVELQR